MCVPKDPFSFPFVSERSLKKPFNSFDHKANSPAISSLNPRIEIYFPSVQKYVSNVLDMLCYGRQCALTIISRNIRFIHEVATWLIPIAKATASFAFYVFISFSKNFKIIYEIIFPGEVNLRK